MRKVVGAFIALAAMVAAAASQPGIDKARIKAAEDAARRAAAGSSQRLGAAVESFLRAVEERAVSAAALPQIRAQLALLRSEGFEGPLGETVRDFFRSEKDWEAWRRDFPLHGVSIEGARFGLLFGADPPSFQAGTLVDKARAGASATAFVLAGGAPHAAAAARVNVPGRAVPAVLVLGRPLDDAALSEIGRRTEVALVLSDGHKPIARHGTSGDLARLERAVGSEAAGDAYAGDEGQWAAVARPILPGYALLALAETADAAGAAAATARSTRVIVWSAGALIAVIALFIGFRPGAAPRPVVATDSGAKRAALPMAPVIEETTPTPLATMPKPSLDRSTTIAAPAPADLAGSRTPLRPFGRYILLSQLGEGGMAKVYNAVVFGAEGFRRKFVVKRLRPELVEDQSVVAQFIDEAKMASSLVHSNIVPVLDFGKVDDEYFLATEYILGRDLGRLTDRSLQVDRTGLPVEAVMFIAQEVLKALEYAHGKRGENDRLLGLVHRDVSPGNVLVSARGEVKLFDFGIVKAEGRMTKTQHGVVKGNVSFMSPEQARGLEVDARADLFSLGLVMFTCAAGQLLYSGSTTYELLLKAAAGPGPDEIVRLRRLPSPLGAIIEKATAVDPAARFQSAAEFAAAVHPHVGRGGAELADLIARLFGEDFRREEAAFATATPPSAAPATRVGSS